MRKIKMILAWLFFTCNCFAVRAQLSTANQLHCSRGYFGGFEAGSSNISIDGAGTDYRYNLPNMGGFGVVKNALEAKGIGIKNKTPRSGNFMMVAHNRATANASIWWKVLPVEPGQTYQFGAYVTSVSKNADRSLRLQLSVNDSIIATTGLSDTWGNIHGQFSTPANTTSIKIAIVGDGVFQHGNYVAIDDIYFGNVDKKMFEDVQKNSLKGLKQPALTQAKSKVATAKSPQISKRKLPAPATSTLRSSSNKPVIEIYPNPARDYFVININSFVFGTTLVQILNESGKVVFTREAHVSVGLNAITISDRKNLSGGNYKVQIISGKDVCNHDLVVL